MAEENLDTLLALSPARLKQSLGIVPPKHTKEYSDNIIVRTMPCIGRIHFVRDREGILFLSGVVAYWLYGIVCAYYCVIQPHYMDGRLPAGVVYYYLSVAALCLVTLLRAATLNPGRVPLIEETSSTESKNWQVCHRCMRPKPGRAHHCRRCQQCVMKMDHHCPWINNCVGEANHHIFVLLLFYSLLFSVNTLVFLTLNYWLWPKCQLCDHEVFYIKHGLWFQYLLTGMAGFMAFAMFVQLMTQHWNVITDTTTIETMQADQEKTMNKYLQKIYYKSIFKGYSDLFGTKLICLWLFPFRRKPSSPEGNMMIA